MRHVKLLYFFPQLVFGWETRSRAPEKLSRGAAVISGNTVYISGRCKAAVYAYHVDDDKWSRLPDCTQELFGLAVINDHLTAVGGRKGVGDLEPLNSLVSLCEGEWVELLPPMPTQRTDPAVMTTADHKYAVVAGGDTNWMSTKHVTVELLEIGSLQWMAMCDLPKPLYGITGTICGGSIYCLDEHCSGYTCTVESLISSCKSHTAHTTPQTSAKVWLALPQIPVDFSSPASICGQLVIFGGADATYHGCYPDRIALSTIHQYDPTSNNWVYIGSLPRAKEGSLVAELPGDRILVVGGMVEFSLEDSVEIGSLLSS